MEIVSETSDIVTVEMSRATYNTIVALHEDCAEAIIRSAQADLRMCDMVLPARDPWIHETFTEARTRALATLRRTESR